MKQMQHLKGIDIFLPDNPYCFWVFGKNNVFLPSQTGLVVQLVRMPPCHGGGREFESRPDRKILPVSRGDFFYIFVTHPHTP
jgi:hypothetical protein